MQRKENMITTNLNDWYCISVTTSKDDTGIKSWIAKGNIYRRDNNEPIDSVSGFGATTTLAEQDARKVAYNRPVISVKPTHWHPVL